MSTTKTPFDARGLVGHWRALGTFHEGWSFAADGTGGAWLGDIYCGETQLRFTWEAVEEGAMRIRLLSTRWVLDGRDDETEVAEPWERLEVVTGPVESDANAIWTPPGAGFWRGRRPLVRR